MSETTTEASTSGTLPPDGAPAPAAPPEEVGQGTGWWRLAVVVAATAAVGLWASLSTLAVILAIVFMIFMHELGHYLTAKAAGMKVTEFFIGFGPKLWSFRRGETEYGLKAIPAGAYVRIIGMSNLEEVDPSEEHRTYRQQPYWRRMSVAVAGSTMHFLMALVLIFIVLVGFGIPDEDSDRWTVGTLYETSPAAEAGLEPGDRLVAVDGRRFENFTALSRYLRERPGEEVSLGVERGGEELALSADLARENPDGEEVGFLGITPSLDRITRGPVSGAVESVRFTGETMWLSVKGLGAFFSPSGISGYFDTLTSAGATDGGGDGGGAGASARASDGAGDEGRVISIYGAVRMASAAAETSIGDVLGLLFVINVFIGVFNLVPLLPLDGGHVIIATYERIRSRKGRPYHADVAKLLPLTYAVVVVLILVGVTSLYLDITDPVSLR
ncbi:MAG: site-2 protease family protein [Actinomycetota bacterium]|nr:site-2 protease family protein [Actinomycetota bacterium]